MAKTPRDPPVADVEPPQARLDSWKEIAAYLHRDVSTVQRWEKREGMPVHRHIHDKLGSVYAMGHELDAWSRSRTQRLVSTEAAPEIDTAARRWTAWLAIATAALLVAAIGVSRLVRMNYFWRSPIADARFRRVTDFEAMPQAAAVSRDGKFVAFLSDRNGRTDAWVTQIGAGQFYNLTRESGLELGNSAVRTVTFSPDGATVYIWARRSGGPNTGTIGVWSVPTLGGPIRPYLDGAAETDWTGDGGRLVYHTTGPGDPMFVTTSRDVVPGRQIFVAPPGRHAHFPVWSRDQAFIYFVQGTVPDEMDLWRIRPDGTMPERITFQSTRISYPVFVDARTMLYLATDGSGDGPWLYGLDVERRVPHRVAMGVDRYESLSASADGRRLVATLANSTATLWRVPLSDTAAERSAATEVTLTSGSGRSPRLGPDYLLYVASTGANDAIWTLTRNGAAQIWSEPGTQILGGPAISADGTRVAVSAGQPGRTRLYVMNADGTNAKAVTDALALRGAPAWAPDGRSLLTAADDRGIWRIYNVSLDGRPPTRLISEYSAEPAWAPDGRFIVYSGADVGTTFRVKAISADGRPYPLPDLTLARGARRVRFLPGRNALVVLKGEIEHKDLWLVDLTTGQQHQLTNFGHDFIVRDFDVSPDGRELVIERAQERSDVVLIDRSSE